MRRRINRTAGSVSLLLFLEHRMPLDEKTGRWRLEFVVVWEVELVFKNLEM